MRAHQIMTKNVITIRPNVSIGEAARLMLEHHMSGLPVRDNGGKLVGIVLKKTFCVVPKSARSAVARAVTRN